MELYEGERLDDFHGEIKIIQAKDVFSSSTDAVLLANFVRLDRDVDRVMDLGSGTGALPLLLIDRFPQLHITGLEIQERLVNMSRRSLLLNYQAGVIPPASIEIHQGDLKEAAERFGHGRFDAVVSNPPYMEAGIGEQNPNIYKAIARHEIHATLADVCRTAAQLVKSGGKVFMVYRSLRLAELMTEMRANALEPKRMRLVAPAVDREANVVLVEAIKDAKPGLRIEPTIAVR